MQTALTCLEAASNTAGRAGFVFNTLLVALYTGLQNAALLTSFDGMTCLYWYKQGGRVSLMHSAAAGHHGTCVHHGVITQHAHYTHYSLRRKHFKTFTTSEDKLQHLVQYFSLQSPSSVCPYIKKPVLVSFAIFKSPFPHISTAFYSTKAQENSPTLLPSSPCYIQSSACHSAQTVGWVLDKNYQIRQAPVILADITTHSQLLQVKAIMVKTTVCACGDANLERTKSHALLSPAQLPSITLLLYSDLFPFQLLRYK